MYFCQAKVINQNVLRYFSFSFTNTEWCRYFWCYPYQIVKFWNRHLTIQALERLPILFQRSSDKLSDFRLHYLQDSFIIQPVYALWALLAVIFRILSPTAKVATKSCLISLGRMISSATPSYWPSKFLITRFEVTFASLISVPRFAILHNIGHYISNGVPFWLYSLNVLKLKSIICYQNPCY